jgi:hypothetical protein
LPKVNFAQRKYVSTQENYPTKDDSYKVAKTILRQGHLLPLPQIIQPVMWAYATDVLNLTPSPDFLILADECQDYYHAIDDDERRVCHVMNPGNFAND